ncbi:MAG: hypothetical protein GY859_43575 [Desulfobacterales bacterium]|nr:hypothetical protein [Desulfobacterales bacterium]
MKLNFNAALTLIDRCFDAINERWESEPFRRFIGLLLVVVYILSFLCVEIKQRGLAPGAISALLPDNHFYAVGVAFTLLLYVEVVDLVLGLTRSVSEAMGKQFQIFSLILLRQSFKKLAGFHEPLQWEEIVQSVPYILSESCGALFIFFSLVLYYRMLHHQPIADDDKAQLGFIAAKKLLSLLLLFIFTSTAVYYSVVYVATGRTVDFFSTFYMVLIFSDILMALISLRYSHSFPVVFRNSGFALATVVLRLALAAPSYYDAALGAGAVLYVLGLTMAYNLYVPFSED